MGGIGFLHTSLSSVQAHRHARPSDLIGRIALPAGSPALFSDGHPFEQEILLPPGTTLMLVRRSKETVRVGCADRRNMVVLDLRPRFT